MTTQAASAEASPFVLSGRGQLTMSFDMRAPAFGAPAVDLYRAALAQAQWADEHGFDAILVNEHHGSPDGYLPAPLVLGAAIAAGYGLHLKPLLAGLAPDVSWRSLRLIESDVLPYLSAQ